ncbi:Aste57867_10616 [Aphanomyces stellatus]|uniref:Aste57867_10616 protein n=1 Tax=Aphanomyces stellatus TaxID=120398 RepID=A0A485KRW4_9STRA|nr:hypothetical protein As57867_010576 [Aphanomyces stellatus]VFT87488.1 Aste57867_10616 [Aphanomyces stellatus]
MHFTLRLHSGYPQRRLDAVLVLTSCSFVSFLQMNSRGVMERMCPLLHLPPPSAVEEVECHLDLVRCRDLEENDVVHTILLTGYGSHLLGLSSRYSLAFAPRDASNHETRPSTCSNDDEDDDPTAEFPALVLQLTAAEEHLKNASNLLVKHSNALVDLLQTTTDIHALTAKQFNSSNDEEDTAMEEEQKTFANSVAVFRTTAIAPLQALLASFPQLKHRIDHRKSALGTWKRYQRKVEEIEARGDASRLHRNKLKCTAAQDRFHQLDKDVQREVAHILSLDIGMLIEVPMLRLVDAQQLWASTMQSATNHLRHAIGSPSSSLVAPLPPSSTPSSSPKKITKSIATEPQVHPDDDVHPPPAHRVSSFHHLSVGDAATAPPPAPVTVVVKPSEELEVLDKTRSLRPKKQHAYGTRTWQMHQHVKQSLAHGLDVVDSVQLPPGYSKDEWVAVHTIDFYNEVSLLYGTISELCTGATCPEMGAGPCYTYLWADEQGAPVACSAPVYVSNLMTWIDGQLSDPAVFPDHGFETNKAFAAASRNILKRLFRVYAHIYHNHVGDFAALHADAHLNFSFKRFVTFVLAFDLVEKKELNALGKLIAHLAPAVHDD